MLIASTNKDIAAWVKRSTGLGWTTRQRRHGHQRDAYYFYITDSYQMLEFIGLVKPYLRIKKHHALVMEQILHARLRGNLRKQRPLALRLRRMNKRGRGN